MPREEGGLPLGGRQRRRRAATWLAPGFGAHGGRPLRRGFGLVPPDGGLPQPWGALPGGRWYAGAAPRNLCPSFGEHPRVPQVPEDYSGPPQALPEPQALPAPPHWLPLGPPPPPAPQPPVLQALPAPLQQAPPQPVVAQPQAPPQQQAPQQPVSLAQLSGLQLAFANWAVREATFSAGYMKRVNAAGAVALSVLSNAALLAFHGQRRDAAAGLARMRGRLHLAEKVLGLSRDLLDIFESAELAELQRDWKKAYREHRATWEAWEAHFRELDPGASVNTLGDSLQGRFEEDFDNSGTIKRTAKLARSALGMHDRFKAKLARTAHSQFAAAAGHQGLGMQQ